MQVDAASVDFDSWVVPTEQTPQWLAFTFAFEIPQSDIQGGHGKGGQTAAADKVHVPPHLLPELLDAARLCALQNRGQVALDHGVDRRAADVADGVRVAEPFEAVVGANAGGHQGEVGDVAVGGIGEYCGQGNAVVVGLYRGDLHTGFPLTCISL